MLRRAYFVFHLCGYKSVMSLGSLVSMPRRAYFVFHRAQVRRSFKANNACFNAPKGLFCISPMDIVVMYGDGKWTFQCPEGLILYFTCRRLSSVWKRLTAHVSMPRRAYFVFHQSQNIRCGFTYTWKSFNAPKGLFCISPNNRKSRPQTRGVFQCPEGLILYFTLMAINVVNIKTSRYVSMPRRAYFVFHRKTWNTVEHFFQGFNAPKGLFCISPDVGHRWTFFPSNGFNAPKGLFCISPQTKDTKDQKTKTCFNAPKGLFCISPVGSALYTWCERMKFQCPEGLNLFSILGSCTPIHLLSTRFNAPKGWIHFLSHLLLAACEGLRVLPGFNAPKGWIHFLSRSGGDWSLLHEDVFQCPEGLNSFSIYHSYPRPWVATGLFQCPEGLNSFSIRR